MPDECIDMEEKDPDIIPPNKGNFLERSHKSSERPNPDRILAFFQFIDS